MMKRVLKAYFQKLVVAIKNQTSVFATTQLPQFRGRRQKDYLAFFETKTFDNHYKALNKKEFLVESGHNSLGDFKEKIVKLCENFPILPTIRQNSVQPIIIPRICWFCFLHNIDGEGHTKGNVFYS